MIEFLEQLSDEENEILINRIFKLGENEKLINTFICDDDYKSFVVKFTSYDKGEYEQTFKLNDVNIQSDNFLRIFWLRNMYEYMYERFGNAWALKAIKYPYYDNLSGFAHNKTCQHLLNLKHRSEQQNTSTQIL